MKCPSKNMNILPRILSHNCTMEKIALPVQKDKKRWKPHLGQYLENDSCINTSIQRQIDRMTIFSLSFDRYIFHGLAAHLGVHLNDWHQLFAEAERKIMNHSKMRLVKAKLHLILKLLNMCQDLAYLVLLDFHAKSLFKRFVKMASFGSVKQEPFKI